MFSHFTVPYRDTTSVILNVLATQSSTYIYCCHVTSSNHAAYDISSTLSLFAKVLAPQALRLSSGASFLTCLKYTFSFPCILNILIFLNVFI